VHSRVAKAVGAAEYGVKPSLTCAYYSYWSGVPVDGVELYPRPGLMIAAGATNDEQTLVIVYLPKDFFPEVRVDVEGKFFEATRHVDGLEDRLREGERAEPFRGTGHLPFYLRKPYGPGWALVGDAGYHKDPISAQGITDAFRDAELLADALDDGFSGSSSLDDALEEYERRRNGEVMPIYEFTHQMGALEPAPPEMQALFAALQDDEEEAARFLGTVAGTVPIAEFFAPENVARIVGAREPGLVSST
jgi:2-polyprenyl-6-methoxyphenol hydroxylase-like FAD-dependent oxidoreductase